MVNHDSPEEVAKRASQEDPIVMYLVVRESINMSIGKTAAQCAHASQMLTLNYMDLQKTAAKIQKALGVPQMEPADRTEGIEHYKRLAVPISIFGEWMAASFRKVVLTADEKEWAKLKEEAKNQQHVIVRDAGLTELEPGTETVIGLWPMRKSSRSKLMKRLQNLK
jgi:peptidyl-tRNA hydrolase, PTH2 family